MFDKKRIRRLAGRAVYDRGFKYFRDGLVHDLVREGDPLHPHKFLARVHGTKVYNTTVVLDENRDIVDYSCTCPAIDEYDGPCKHVVALLLEVLAYFVEHDAEAEAEDEEELEDEEAVEGLSEEDLERMLDRQYAREHAYRKPAEGERLLALFAPPKPVVPLPAGAQQVLRLEPRLFFEEGYSGMQRWLEFRIGAEKMYVMRNVHDFLRDAREGKSVRFGQKLMVDTAHMVFEDALSRDLWAMLNRIYDLDQENWDTDRPGYYSGYFSSPWFDGKRFMLIRNTLDEFLDMLGEQSIELHFNDGPAVQAGQLHGCPPIRLELVDRGRKGALLEIFLDGPMIVLNQDFTTYFLKAKDGVRFYRTTPEKGGMIKLLFQAFGQEHAMRLKKEELAPFFGQVMPKLEQVAQVDVPESLSQKYQLAPLRAKLYFDYHGEGIEVRPVFAYADQEFNPLVAKGPGRSGKRTLVRDTQAEQEIMGYFEAYAFMAEGPSYVQPDEDQSYDFLHEALPSLSEKADIYYADGFQEQPVRRMPQVKAGVSVSASNLLEVTFDTDELDLEELMNILRDYRRKKRYHRMPDGSFLSLDDEQLGSLSDFVESTGVDKVDAAQGGKVELPLSQAMYIDALAREDENLRLERSKQFRRMVRDVRNPQDADVEADVPASLEHVLRDYQLTGFNWLSSLAKYGLGGILADDMGLGKTLQVLAFLLANRDTTQPPSLVVAPTSLVYNWLDEAARFTPGLKAKVIAGTKAERRAVLAATGTECDVLITTYNMLKRDIELYRERHFRFVFLDEAQHIKNATTQNARAVKALKAADYFALTGTPIENTLTELWSIFDFLMPGYLLNHNSFKKRYETPIVKEQDKGAVRNLQRHVMPFILRRLKKDVLKELPDKVERRMMAELTPKQKKLYQAWFLRTQKEFETVLKENGIESGRLKILALLTRLRQIACDPSLFLEDYDGGSGKLDLLEEVVGDAVAAGHRMLIFSQFTTMLAHIGERLQQAGVDYLYLDGSTSSLERMRLVKDFNAGRGQAFLISLKAGGTGLNLTGADMVIHFDPWWNPAVEDQATDRAYRLGQKNNVQVLKFITKGTVEEKIYELQEKKKSLIDQMIQPGENFLSKLSNEEIADLFAK